METGCIHEIIQREACKETNYKQSLPGNGKRKPDQGKKIQVRDNKPVQVRDLVQHINLHQNENGQPEDIFNQVAQLLLFLLIYFSFGVFLQ